MKMRAKVTSVYDDKSVAQAIASALQPDNLQAPKGIEIKTSKRGRKIVTKVEMEGKIETLLSTLDDLLSCTSTAESTIS